MLLQYLGRESRAMVSEIATEYGSHMEVLSVFRTHFIHCTCNCIRQLVKCFQIIFLRSFDEQGNVGEIHDSLF